MPRRTTSSIEVRLLCLRRLLTSIRLLGACDTISMLFTKLRLLFPSTAGKIRKQLLSCFRLYLCVCFVFARSLLGPPLHWWAPLFYVFGFCGLTLAAPSPMLRVVLTLPGDVGCKPIHHTTLERGGEEGRVQSTSILIAIYSLERLFLTLPLSV